MESKENVMLYDMTHAEVSAEEEITMGDDALFNLRWDVRRTALLESVGAMYRNESFVDVTLAANNGETFKAHKLLLSASSPFFKGILESVPSQYQYPVLILPHVSAYDLGNVLKVIYEGEIKINRRALKSFLETAKLLQINGMEFDLEKELTHLDSINQPGQSNSSASSSSASYNKNGTASRSTVTKAQTTTKNNEDDDTPEILKILSAPPLNQEDESQGSSSLSDPHYSTIPSSSATKADAPHGNNSSNMARLSNIDCRHMSHVGKELEGTEEDAHNELDMVVEDENSRSQESISSTDSDSESIAIDENETIQEFDDDISILSEVSLREPEESSSQMRSRQNISSGQGNGSQQNGMVKLPSIFPKSCSSGGFNGGVLLPGYGGPWLLSGYTGSAAEWTASTYSSMGVRRLWKTIKRTVQCDSCNKVLSSLSALKRHKEDVHCARIQGKCLICGRVYSSRNSLLTHVYSVHKKHHDYKAVARIIRESEFEKFTIA